jgi:hypothetical protein
MKMTRELRTADLVALDHRLQARFVDRDLITLEPGNLIGIHIHTCDVITRLRQAGAGH